MITIRPMTTGDLSLFKKWLYAPHVAKWYHDPLEWIAEAEQQKDVFNWIHHYIVELDNRKIGFCQYYACADSDELWGGDTQMGGSFSVDYLIGEPDCIGKGFGKIILLSLLEKIKGHSDAKRIVVQPEPANSASIGVLLSCSFIYDREKDMFVFTI